ncbi:MAG: hypothetical protein H8E21_07285 [Gammaproteobacteria bacterium]|nr:hypothetical protein [Gammaproteobacteria bacterium]MBL6999059.1 hypothetical protein [Gammaproteobacteria bacterium]
MGSGLAQYKSIVFRLAGQVDNENLNAILRENEMDSWVMLSLEREPSFFAGEALMGESHTVIAFEQNDPMQKIGMYSCSYFQLRINGRTEQVGYLGGLRILKKYRNRIRYVRNGYDSIRKIVPEADVIKHWFSSIASENSSARKLLESGLKGLPRYAPIGEVNTIAISVAAAKSCAILERVTEQTVGEFVSFFNSQTGAYQYAPVLNDDWIISQDKQKGLSIDDFYLIRQNLEVVGCLAVWDQRAFKQTVVRGYRFPLNRFRKIHNAWSVVTKRISLPAPGNSLEHVYISFMAFSKGSEHLVVPAIREALAIIKQMSGTFAVTGLSEKNPLTPFLLKHFKTLVYRSCIEAVSWDSLNDKNEQESAVQPEIALL